MVYMLLSGKICPHLEFVLLYYVTLEFSYISKFESDVKEPVSVAFPIFQKRDNSKFCTGR